VTALARSETHEHHGSREQVLRSAIAALDDGRQAQVLEAAESARACGEPDIAWLLELLAGRIDLQAANHTIEVPGAGQVPELLRMLYAWRCGRAPRGSSALRKLAADRPALHGLLDVLGKKRTRPAEHDLTRLTPRAAAVLVAAWTSTTRRDVDLAELLPEQSPDAPLDLRRYRRDDALYPIEPLLAWQDDPQVQWDADDQGIAIEFVTRRRLDLAPMLLGALLRTIHRRLAEGHGHGLLGPIVACSQLAEKLHKPALAQHLGVLERRLGALLEPDHYLPALLTLWRRNMGLPERERLVIARRVVEAMTRMLARHEHPPPQVPIALEALAWFINHTEDAAMRTGLLAKFAWLLPGSAVAAGLAKLAPADRTCIQALHALERGDLVQPLAAVLTLARDPDSGARASDLLSDVLEVMEYEPHARRQLERTLTELRTLRPQLAPTLLPRLLQITDELNAGVEPARALVRQALERPVADHDPNIAAHIVALHLLGDEADEAAAQERVRLVGRWLRRLDPDAADELALAVLARVFAGLHLSPDPEPLQRLTAPLSSFVLRDGPERAERAARRSNAQLSPWTHGYGAWARAHADQLRDIPYWRSLAGLAVDLDDDDDDTDIPF
jgi:hypothetical protein